MAGPGKRPSDGAAAGTEQGDPAGVGLRPALNIAGAVARITLRRPASANRLEREDLDELLGHLAVVDHRPEIRVLLLTAQGRHFCSGFNLSDSMASAPSHFARVADALERTRPVSVAVMQGGAFGGAVDLALACDLRIGGPAVQAAVPAVKLGLQFYRSGLQRAVQRLPWITAQRLYLMGHRLSAEELLRAGFLLSVAKDEAALDGDVARLCEDLLLLAPLALTGIKRALVEIGSGRVADPDVAAAVDASAARTESSRDLAEGVRAWREGRPPVFEGR